MSMFILKVSHISLKKSSINKTMEREFWYLNSPIIKYLINISGNYWIIAECFKTAPNKGKSKFYPHFLNNLWSFSTDNSTKRSLPHNLYLLTHYFCSLVTDIRILWLTDDNSFREMTNMFCNECTEHRLPLGGANRNVQKPDEQVQIPTIHSA